MKVEFNPGPIPKDLTSNRNGILRLIAEHQEDRDVLRKMADSDFKMALLESGQIIKWLDIVIHQHDPS